MGVNTACKKSSHWSSFHAYHVAHHQGCRHRCSPSNWASQKSQALVVHIGQRQDRCLCAIRGTGAGISKRQVCSWATCTCPTGSHTGADQNSNWSRWVGYWIGIHSPHAEKWLQALRSCYLLSRALSTIPKWFGWKGFVKSQASRARYLMWVQLISIMKCHDLSTQKKYFIMHEIRCLNYDHHSNHLC